MTDSTAITTDTYNLIAEMYAEKYFDDVSDFKRITSFFQDIPKNGSVLEVGCGAGQFVKYLLSCGFLVTGVDLSESMLTLAHKKVPEGKFQLMDMRFLTFDDNQFDAVLAAYSLIHIPTAEIVSTLKGFYRVLKPGGKLCIIAQRGAPDHFVDESLAPGKRVFFNFFTSDKIRTFLEVSGFINISIDTVTTDDSYTMSDALLYVYASKRSDTLTRHDNSTNLHIYG